VRRVLIRFAWSGLFRKHLGFRVARLKRKPKVSCLPPSSPVTTSEVSSGLVLNRLPHGGLEVTMLGAKEGASPASSAFVGDSTRSEPSSAADTGTVSGTESSSGGESSSSQVFPAVSSRTQPLICSVSPLLRHRIWLFRRFLLLFLLSSIHWGSFRLLYPFLPLRLPLEQLF
jgi:hypothetical protein